MWRSAPNQSAPHRSALKSPPPPTPAAALPSHVHAVDYMHTCPSPPPGPLCERFAQVLNDIGKPAVVLDVACKAPLQPYPSSSAPHSALARRGGASLAVLVGTRRSA